MPCYSGPPTYEEEYENWEERLRHDSPVAEAFCELCRHLERKGIPLTPLSNIWWRAHKKRDAAKSREEKKERMEDQAKERARSKLSAKERRLLGVRDAGKS